MGFLPIQGVRDSPRMGDTHPEWVFCQFRADVIHPEWETHTLNGFLPIQGERQTP